MGPEMASSEPKGLSFVVTERTLFKSRHVCRNSCLAEEKTLSFETIDNLIGHCGCDGCCTKKSEQQIVVQLEMYAINYAFIR